MATPDPQPPQIPTSAVAVIEGLRTLRTFIWAGAVVALGWLCVAEPVRALAGQQTLFDVEALIDLDLHVALPYVAAVLSTALWYRERRLRKTTIRRENERNRKLEQTIDPERTSSGFEE